MFQRILVPLDGSARAEYALPIAARIARALGGSVYLLEVVSPLIDYSGGFAMIPQLTEHLIEAEMTAATDYLQTMVASPKLSGIETTTEVAFGLPAQYILTSARSGETDLNVLCSHGRTGLTRWVLGSVAHTLAHESTVPTLVLRESEPASRLSGPAATRPLCALVPLDGSELAETALARPPPWSQPWQPLRRAHCTWHRWSSSIRKRKSRVSSVSSMRKPESVPGPTWHR